MKNSRHNLFKNLQHTYCRLKPSTVHGVGVFAIQRIPKGVDPFQRPKFVREKFVEISPEMVNTLPVGVQQMVRDFFAPTDRGTYPVVSEGLNSISISFYLNHSDTPNVDLVNDQRTDYFSFVTNRPIEEGEELFIKYST